MRSNLVLPTGTSLDSDNASIAISPDGMTLAYAAREETGPGKLWIRPLTSLIAQPLAGTEGASYPTWSPDGLSIAFFADGKLKKVRASGGAVQTLCPAPNGRGAAWGTGDLIVFTPDTFGPLFQVPASGGAPTALTTVPGEISTHRNPHFLPDGKHVLFFSGKAAAGDPEQGIHCLNLATKKTELVMLVDSEGIYVEPGYLVFVRDRNLMAQPFDASSRKLSGEAIPIAEKVQFNNFRRTGTYTLSRSGMLVYLSDTILRETQLTLYDLDGKPVRTVGEPAMFWLQLRISPDDRRVLTSVRRSGEGSDVWIYDLGRGIGSRFTFNDTGDLGATWSPDGRQVAYADAGGNVSIKTADGTSAPRTITSEPLGTAVPDRFTPDGSGVAVFTNSGKRGTDVVIVPATGSAKPQPLLATSANELGIEFSPDGRWMGYSSDESGRVEYYVTSFPGPGGKWQVSTNGASRGGWLGGGAGAWYVDLEGKFFAVPISTSGGGIEVGTRRPLFGGQALPVDTFEFTHDGKQLLGAARRPSTTGPVLTLVTQWPSALGDQ